MLFSKNFWNCVIVVKLILYISIMALVAATRASLTKRDLVGVKTNFKRLEIASYLLLAFIYFMFGVKIVNHRPVTDLHKKLDHMIYINMALTIVLVLFIRGMRTSIDRYTSDVETLQTQFNMTETLGYILPMFNIFTTGVVILSGEHQQMSPSR